MLCDRPDRDDSPQTNPRARITDVTVAAAASPPRDAASWDRWPRWDASDSATDRGPVTASFQDETSVQIKPLPATFNESDVVRKNSPPRDPGPSTAGNSSRTHIVVDGDSLSRLAERYLDDAALGDEIYRLNRDVLADPELLPIGVELRIPDKRMADATVGLPAMRNLDPPRPQVSSGMVPVEWSPRTFDRTPQVELLSPVSAEQND